MHRQKKDARKQVQIILGAVWGQDVGGKKHSLKKSSQPWAGQELWGHTVGSEQLSMGPPARPCWLPQGRALHHYYQPDFCHWYQLLWDLNQRGNSSDFTQTQRTPGGIRGCSSTGTNGLVPSTKGSFRPQHFISFYNNVVILQCYLNTCNISEKYLAKLPCKEFFSHLLQ